MGNDIEDINNDGLMDVVALDMNPEDNYRKKMNMASNNYQTYLNTEQFGYNYQYVRNTLQLNQGPCVRENDSIGNPVFSDIGFYAGVAETDWSWTPMVVDFDNDGFRDIIVTNGFPKDVTDHDFVAFRNSALAIATKQQLLEQIPEVKLHNYAFRNNGDLRFSDVTKSWGLTEPSYSNGAAYADFDNDGALDMVVNNINDEAMVFRNTSRDKEKKNNHFLKILFEGDSLNRNGLGARVAIFYDHGKTQVYENTPYRGYLSSIEAVAHFGLGNVKSVDSVQVIWPNQKMQWLQNIAADQIVKLNIRNATGQHSYSNDPIAANTLFRDITAATDIHYVHKEYDFIDFNIQKLLPHKFSQYGPALAVGDIDGNGLDDILSGGSALYSAQIFLQQTDGKFKQQSLMTDEQAKKKKSDDLGVLLFDADGDGHPDLFIAAGGYEYDHQSEAYQDRFYRNDGKGNFVLDSAALPKNLTSKFCVRAADFDHDGDLDLFIIGRLEPGPYPQPVNSFIYRNDSKNGQIKFTDVTATVAKDLLNIGLACDAN